MAFSLHETGEEFIQKLVWTPSEITRPSNLEVLLFDNSEDDLTDSSDVEDIETEPTDGNYTRQTVSFDSDGFSILTEDSDSVADMIDITFDVINTTGDVDAFAVIGEFESDRAGDTEPQEHIIFAGGLDQSYPLDKSDELTVENGGISLD